MGRARRSLSLAFALAVAMLPVSAQEMPERPVRSPVLTLNYDLFISASQVGRRMSGDLEAERIILEAENKRIAAELEAEEIVLTRQRETMPAADFRAAARRFDEKVQQIRTARRGLDQELAQRRDTLRQAFDAVALPVLSEIMREAGAGVIVDGRSVVLSVDQIDITRLAIARLDIVYPDGRIDTDAKDTAADPAGPAPAAQD